MMSGKNILIIWLLWLVLPAPAAAEKGEPRYLKAGAAMSNITPFLGDEIVGDFNTPKTVHIHDDLYARCVVLDDGSTRLAFGVIDNVFIRQEVLDAAKQLIVDKTGIPIGNIMLAATHTHSATSASGKGKLRVAWKTEELFDPYQRLVIRRIADGMVRAVNNLQSARIAYGSVDIPEHVFNRRWEMKPGTRLPNPFGGEDKVKMNPRRNDPNLLKPAGPTDPEVVFLAVESLEGRPIALMANYSLHYVGGVPIGHVSADYFGVFARKIGILLGMEDADSSFVGIMTNGTSGDVNNIDFRSEVVKHKPYEKMEVVAADIANKIFDAYQQLEFNDWVSLNVKAAKLTLGVRKPTPKQLERAHRVPQLDNKDYYVSAEPVYAERIIDMKENWPDSMTVDIQVFRIGKLAIGAVPFEMFAEAGLELKERSPFEITCIVGLANGGFGYLPTFKQHQLGGYETWLGTNRVEVHASEKIVDKLLDNMRALKDQR